MCGPWIAVLLIGMAGPAASEAGRQTEGNRLPPIPLLVTGMVHLDPLGSAVGDSSVAITNYGEHRDGVLWYIGLAGDTGLRLSAQTTGTYAEACIRQGDWSDFASFMPGGNHHFGTHIHPKVKWSYPYAWRELPDWARSDPDSVRLVLFDSIPWINQIYLRNGYDPLYNSFYHGSSAFYEGMEEDLWCPPTPPPQPPYPNCFDMADGERGQLWVYRGPWGLEPFESPDRSYVKIPEVAGIIGFDSLHGPEGFVYGTVPYQKRDFLRAYIEWREMVRRGERSAVRHFTWMIHPYQLPDGYLGSDGNPVRESIANLVLWLNERWIEKMDESGNTIAEYANGAQIKGHYESWEIQYPDEAEELQSNLEEGHWPLYLPAIHERLDDCFYVDEVAYPDTVITLHELEDHSSSREVFAVWSRSGNRPLGHWLGAAFSVLHGDGTVQTLLAEEIVIEEEPVLLEPIPPAGLTDLVEDSSLSLRVSPLPIRGTAMIGYSLARATTVSLSAYDSVGRKVWTEDFGLRSAGGHSQLVSTVGWRSGVYFIRLRAGQDEVIGKMVIVD